MKYTITLTSTDGERLFIKDATNYFQAVLFLAEAHLLEKTMMDKWYAKEQRNCVVCKKSIDGADYCDSCLKDLIWDESSDDSDRTAKDYADEE